MSSRRLYRVVSGVVAGPQVQALRYHLCRYQVQLQVLMHTIPMLVKSITNSLLVRLLENYVYLYILIISHVYIPLVQSNC